MISMRTMLPLALALAATVALTAPAAASAACTGGKTAWTLNGKKVCVKTPPPRLGTTAESAPAILRDWVLRIAKPTRYQRLKLSRAFRRAVPKAARQASGLAARVRDRKPATASRGAARRSPFSLAIAADSPVIDRVELSSPEINAGNGVKVRSVVEGFEREDGSSSFDYRIEMTKGRDTVRLTPAMDFLSGGNKQQCPTAEGLVTETDRSRTGGTMMILRGRSVKRSITEIVETESQGRGYVGRDAKLGRVEADVVVTSKRYERGLSIEYIAKSGVSMDREGAAGTTGTPSVRVKARAAGNTAAEERAFERDYAATLAKSQNVADALGDSGEVIRQRLLNGEYVWYQIPNFCVSVEWEPWPEATLNHGATKAVTASVKANNGGGTAAAEFQTGGVSRGSFGAVKQLSDPGSPAQFTATGAAQDDNPQTVVADGTMTSTAGRAAWDWSASRLQVDFPAAFTGNLSVLTTDGASTRYEFAGTATYTRTSVYVSPEGFATAWYEMSAGNLTSALHAIGPGGGCRWEATGSGGTIESGDLELRKPLGQPVTYALLFDMAIVDANYPSVDCPPGSELPPFTGDLVAYLYTTPAGQPFRPVGAGYAIEATDVTDVTGASSLPTTASWSFAPVPD